MTTKKKTKRARHSLAAVNDMVMAIGLEDAIRTQFGRDLRSPSNELNELWREAFDNLVDIEEFLLQEVR